MKKIYAAAIITLATHSSAYAAGESVEKPFTVGLGTYASITAYDNTFYEDDEFSGLSLYASYAINDNVAFRANFFSLEHDDFSEIDSKGYDLVALAGANLGSEGFKIYGGGGLFKDKVTIDFGYTTASESFSGLQLMGGIGYNWPQVALDLILGIRDSSDYDDFFGTETATVSSSLTLGFRF